nr:MAG TPA: hypothetical protein [Caudoviricetes sp.]
MLIFCRIYFLSVSFFGRAILPPPFNFYFTFFFSWPILTLSQGE